MKEFLCISFYMIVIGYLECSRAIAFGGQQSSPKECSALGWWEYICCQPQRECFLLICLFGFLWHINLCRLFDAKSIFIQIISSNPWCNCYRRRKWTRRQEFKSWTRMISFHIALIPLGKVWIQLFSLQLWANSRTDWVLQPWWSN